MFLKYVRMRKTENSKIRDTYSRKNWENWRNLIKCEDGQIKFEIFKGFCTLMLSHLFWNIQAVKEIHMLPLSTQTVLWYGSVCSSQIYHQSILRNDTSRDPCNTANLFRTHFPRRVIAIVEDSKIKITLHFHV